MGCFGMPVSLSFPYFCLVWRLRFPFQLLFRFITLFHIMTNSNPKTIPGLLNGMASLYQQESPHLFLYHKKEVYCLQEISLCSIHLCLQMKSFESVYGRIKEYIEGSGDVDYRPMRMVQEHFNTMKMKLNYLKSKGYLKLECLDKTIACYTEASLKAEMLVMTAVKYTVVSKDKKEKVKQSVLSQLEKLVDAEKIYLKEFLGEAYSHENGSGSGCEAVAECPAMSFLT